MIIGLFMKDCVIGQWITIGMKVSESSFKLFALFILSYFENTALIFKYNIKFHIILILNFGFNKGKNLMMIEKWM